MGAKLFGIAALVIAVIALVPARATDTSLDLYLTRTHFLLSLFSPIIFILEAHGLRRADQAGRDPSQSWPLLARFVAPFLAFARRCSCIPCELCPGNCTEASKPKLKIIDRCGRSWLATAVGMGPTSP